MLNETIIQALNAITPAGIPWFVGLLAVCGLIWLLQTIMHTGINFVFFMAYVIGLGKWLVRKIKRKNEKKEMRKWRWL